MAGKGRMEKQNQSRIVRIPLGRANAYFVIGEGKVLLIDTGEKGNAGKILRALENLGLSRLDLSLIILTHTHYDHCGSLKTLKDMTGAKVLVHSHEAMCLKYGYGGIPRGTNRLTKVVSLIGRTIGKRMGRYEPVSPDFVISGVFGLEEHGVDGHVLPTPGHTPGSISIIIRNKDAVVGDTLFNIFRKGVFPPFADDQQELLRSWLKLCDTGCEFFYPGHGTRVGIDRLRQSLRLEKKRRSSPRDQGAF